jgi:serine phosphatase RsbU (regulator of sigma subunit)
MGVDSRAFRGMDIGGDFYDLVRVSDTIAAAVIGDVQGHNLSAAALMGRIRPAIRSHALAGATPAQALARANRQLVDMDPGRFVSCLYAHLDLARHRAVLATAGHPPPVLRYPDGHAEVLALPPGLLLGIDPHADYPSTEIPLTPGTVLALYTDGLIETPGVDLGDAMTGLAAQLAQAWPQPMDRLATVLIDHARQTATRTTTSPCCSSVSPPPDRTPVVPTADLVTAHRASLRQVPVGTAYLQTCR